jgi:hypothetical protein
MFLITAHPVPKLIGVPEMTYTVDFGSAKLSYSSIDRIPEDALKIFRFMLYFQAREMSVGKTSYKVS